MDQADVRLPERGGFLPLACDSTVVKVSLSDKFKGYTVEFPLEDV